MFVVIFKVIFIIYLIFITSALDARYPPAIENEITDYGEPPDFSSPHKKPIDNLKLPSTNFPNKYNGGTEFEEASNLNRVLEKPDKALKLQTTEYSNPLNNGDADYYDDVEDELPNYTTTNPFVGSNRKRIQFSNKDGIDIEGENSKLRPRRTEGSFCRRSFDNSPGYCIFAFQCLHVIREYSQHGTQIDICTHRNNVPVICCPLIGKDIIEYSPRISEKKCQKYYDVARDIKIGKPRTFTGKTCTNSSVPMIVGGEMTLKKEYPHMAAIGYKHNYSQINWNCGGSLISKRFVLTAAHCITSSGKAPDVVRLGAHNLNSRDELSKEDFKIASIIIHPEYNTTLYYHDIALIKLSKNVNFSEKIRPACLWQLPHLNIRTAIAVGWGRTGFMEDYSDGLRKVNLRMIDQKRCKEAYQRERRLPKGVVKEQFCAGHMDGGKDTCQGDSGGPLHAELPEYKCVKFIVGITSFGKYCGAPNAPGVYTNVYAYLDWIERIIYKLKIN